MPRIKRNAKKLAFLSPRIGRPPNTVTKWNMLARHYFEENNLNVLAMIIKELDLIHTPKDRCDILLKLVPYIYPTLTAAKIDINEVNKTPALEKLSNSDLIAKAKLILERTTVNGNEGLTTTTMELIDNEAGGDRAAKGSFTRTSDEDQNGAGEDQ